MILTLETDNASLAILADEFTIKNEQIIANNTILATFHKDGHGGHWETKDSDEWYYIIRISSV